MNRKTITLFDSTTECEHVHNVPQQMMYFLIGILVPKSKTS